MNLSKTEELLISGLVTLIVAVASAWLIMEKYFISTIIICIIGILLILWLNFYKSTKKIATEKVNTLGEPPLVVSLDIKNSSGVIAPSMAGSPGAVQNINQVDNEIAYRKLIHDIEEKAFESYTTGLGAAHYLRNQDLTPAEKYQSYKRVYMRKYPEHKGPIKNHFEDDETAK